MSSWVWKFINFSQHASWVACFAIWRVCYNTVLFSSADISKAQERGGAVRKNISRKLFLFCVFDFQIHKMGFSEISQTWKFNLNWGRREKATWYGMSYIWRNAIVLRALNAWLHRQCWKGDRMCAIPRPTTGLWWTPWILFINQLYFSLSSQNCFFVVVVVVVQIRRRTADLRRCDSA